MRSLRASARFSVPALSALMITMASGAGLAAPGDLDASFGDTGKVLTDFGSPNDAAEGVAIQADGRIVAAGNLAPRGEHSQIAAARYETNGALDATFDGDGKFTLALGVKDSSAADVALQPDGRIILAGSADAGNGAGQDFAAVRLDAAGSLDPTFGGGTGYILTDFGGDDAAASVAIQSNGKIVLGGLTSLHSNDFALARYNADGTLDTTFGWSGRVTTHFLSGPDARSEFINDIALQPDGKIVAVGEVRTPHGPDFGIARYNPNGALDKTFNGTGRVQVDFDDPGEDALSVAIQPTDGAIVVGGQGVNDVYGDLNFDLTRLTASGALDETFGYQGRVRTDFFNQSQDYFGALTIQIDGRIVAGGGTAVARDTPGNFGLARYLPNGDLDPGFGYGGLMVTDLGGSDSILGLALQGDGKILTAGAGGAGGDFALARYLAS